MESTKYGVAALGYGMACLVMLYGVDHGSNPAWLGLLTVVAGATFALCVGHVTLALVRKEEAARW